MNVTCVQTMQIQRHALGNLHFYLKGFFLKKALIRFISVTGVWAYSHDGRGFNKSRVGLPSFNTTAK